VVGVGSGGLALIAAQRRPFILCYHTEGRSPYIGSRTSADAEAMLGPAQCKAPYLIGVKAPQSDLPGCDIILFEPTPCPSGRTSVIRNLTWFPVLEDQRKRTYGGLYNLIQKLHLNPLRLNSIPVIGCMHNASPW